MAKIALKLAQRHRKPRSLQSTDDPDPKGAYSSGGLRKIKADHVHHRKLSSQRWTRRTSKVLWDARGLLLTVLAEELVKLFLTGGDPHTEPIVAMVVDAVSPRMSLIEPASFVCPQGFPAPERRPGVVHWYRATQSGELDPLQGIFNRVESACAYRGRNSRVR